MPLPALPRPPRTYPLPALTAIALAAGLSLPASARAQTAEPTVADLQRQLAERDAVIMDLMRRVDSLERRTPLTPPPPGAALPQPQQQAAAPDRPEDSGLGSDDESQRALERTLVQEGGLTLPAYVIEIQPELNYTYNSTNQLAIIGPTAIGQEKTRRDTMEAALTMRLGLPWTSQIEVRLPFDYDRLEVTANGISRSDDETGLGDIELTLTKQLLQEKHWWPNVLAALTWKTDTGSRDFGTTLPVGTGTGFNSLQGTLTLVKSQDPLVFFGNFSYTGVFSDTKNGIDIEPGNSIGVKLGTILAASPETSLRFAVDTLFTDETKADDITIEGSDAVSAVLELGASSIIARSTLLDLAVLVGLTDDSPDFQVKSSVSYRF